MRLTSRTPPLSGAIGGLQYLQQVMLPAPAAGRTLQLASRQALSALTGPVAAAGGKLGAAAADGAWGLLRVAAAEVHGLSCSGVMLDPSSRLPGNQLPPQQQQRGSRLQPPAYTDGHGAACSAGAWSAPRLLPAAASTAAGRGSLSGMQMRGEPAFW